MSRALRFGPRWVFRPALVAVVGVLSNCGGGSAGPGDGGGTGGAASPASGGAGSGGSGPGGGTESGGRSGTGGVAATGGGGGGSGGSATGGAVGTAGAGGGAGGRGTVGTAGAGGRAATGGVTATGGAAAGGAAGALNPAVGAYGTRANLLASNSEMAAGEVLGKIYLVGGYPSSRVVQTAVQVYDVAANTWSAGRAYPFAIHHPVLASHGGKLYSLGGQTDGADTGRTFVFDPAAATPEWRELRPMPTARGAGAAAVIDDKIYVVGGRPPAGNKFEVYDVSEDAWAALPDLPQTFPQRNHLAATAIGVKIYVAGGRYNGGGFGDPRTDSLDIFDPAAGTWSLGAKMLRPRGGVNGIAANGCFHVWGGEGTNTGEPNDVYPDHDVYDPRLNMWRALPRLPTPIHGVTGAAFVNGLIYIPGGGTTSGGSSGSTIFQVFRPDPAMRCD